MENLLHHFKDFQIQTEWHFFASAHGKGPCDGIGGTVKRLVRRSCLQHPDLLIKTAKQLFEWAQENISRIEFQYFDQKGYYDEEERLLHNRYQNIKTLKRTKKYHSIIPIDNKKFQVREYSIQDNFLEIDNKQ